MSIEAINILLKQWTPHKGQQEALNAALSKDKDYIYVECGRKWGKTEFSVFMCWFYALMKPYSEVYYLCPSDEQAKELAWANNRMQTANTLNNLMIQEIEEVIGGKIHPKDGEMRLIFPNGSFIKCDGSNNYNSHRGYKPDFVACDEYRDFKEEWLDAFKANCLVKDSKLMFLTTPPDHENHAYNLARECQVKSEPYYFYLNHPTTVNNKIPNIEIKVEKERLRLLKLGKSDVFEREYLAKYSSLNTSGLLPQLDVSKFLPNQQLLISEIKQLGSKLEFGISITRNEEMALHGILGAFNPYTAEAYILDVITPRTHPQCKSFNQFLKILTAKCNIFKNCETENNPWSIITVKSDERLYKVIETCENWTLNQSSPEIEKPLAGLDIIKEALDKDLLKISATCKEIFSENAVKSRLGTRQIRALDIPIITGVKLLFEIFNYTEITVPEEEPKPADEQFFDNLDKTKPFNDKLNALIIEKWGFYPDPFAGDEEYF